MKSTAVTSFAALAAVVYSSSAFAAPVDAPVPISASSLPTAPSAEDVAIYEGIAHGIKEGLQTALSEALGTTVDRDLVRDEEVNQVLDCVGLKVTNVIVGCIKKENLSIHTPGDQASQEAHTESIQKCISPSALEHVSYCVGKLEIQRLGEDAHILQQLYEASNLKNKENEYENPEAAMHKSSQTELDQDTSPLFDQNWYEGHKEKASDNDNDLVANSSKSSSSTIPSPPSPPSPPPLPADVKPTNSTASSTAIAATPGDGNKSQGKKIIDLTTNDASKTQAS